MSLRRWAVKAGELRTLSRSGLMLFSARCAIRVEPWLPKSARRVFAEELAFLEAGKGAGALHRPVRA